MGLRCVGEIVDLVVVVAGGVGERVDLVGVGCRRRFQRVDLLFVGLGRIGERFELVVVVADPGVERRLDVADLLVECVDAVLDRVDPAPLGVERRLDLVDGLAVVPEVVFQFLGGVLEFGQRRLVGLSFGLQLLHVGLHLVDILAGGLDDLAARAVVAEELL